MRSLFPAFPERFHRYIYIFALIILVAGMPMSKFLMSLSQIILACNWLLEGNVRNKFYAFYKNKTALIVSSLLLLHFIGLIYSDDLAYGFKDIRIKAPLFVLPLIISTSKPLSQKLIDIILQLFVAAVITATIISSLILIGVIHRPVNDIRDISIFISHIRFALLICVAVFISAYFVRGNRFGFLLGSNQTIPENAEASELSSTPAKIMWSLIILWLVIFLMIMESLTGLVALSITTFILVILGILKSSNAQLKYGSLLLLSSVLILMVYYINSIGNENQQKDSMDFKNLETHTPQGNLYEHDTQSFVTENGHLVWMYCCPQELQESWNQRSTTKMGSTDINGNAVYFTLIRFLTSKGLRKDASAVLSLTNTEVKAIERGVANVNYQNISSLHGRIYETLWEIDLYRKTGQANGHSFTQRFEYWRTAFSIIKKNLFFGVGTGDVPMAFEQEYIKNNSSLSQEWRLRSHNQYLSIAVAFGIIGLLWFLVTLFYPLFYQKTRSNYLYITFFIIALISFFTEDTLETQAGVTFYAFLNSFFLFAGDKQKD